MHAVIRTGGNQYRIEPGDEIDIEKLGDVEAGEEVTFDAVLAVGDGADLDVGRPTVDEAEVVAEVVEHGRGDKKIVFKKKTKQGYRRKHGHRQPYTKVEITDVRT